MDGIVTVALAAAWAAAPGPAAAHAAAAAAKPSPTAAPRHAPAPAWVAPPPVAGDAPLPPGAPVRVVYGDQQVRIDDKGQEVFQAFRIKLLAPEALALGNVTVTWVPASEDVVVHSLRIIREGATIDVLATQTFTVIQRENNLDLAMLDGNLTATLQVAGLQVGDELEFAATRRIRTPDYDRGVQGFMQFPLVGARGAYRLRLLQPKSLAVAYRTSPDLPAPTVTVGGDEVERRWQVVDPASAVIPDGAPPRYAITRIVEYSSYPDWAAVSRAFQPLFAEASALPPGSEVKAEAARIAAATPDPAGRAEAALRLVQDRIRYVYVGLNGGAYRPAAAEETWRRRFGDCKAKTALLIALLHELGVAAEPVLVASKGGDGMDARLPGPSVFDHVLVRATVGGKAYWLDGTRVGDHGLAMTEAPSSRFGLPLRPAGAALEAIPSEPPRRPTLIEAVEIDASAGFDKPGKYHVQDVLRGDAVLGARAQLAGVAPADADRMLAAYWRQRLPDVDPSRTTWRFEEDDPRLVLAMDGEGKVDWDGDAKQGRTHYLLGGGSFPPSEMKRPKDQDQEAAWATDYPAFTCYATTVTVPAAERPFHWSYSATPFDRVLGGVDYWRVSAFDGRTIRIVKSRRVDVPEITAAEARAVNAAIDGFDNTKAYVFETTARAIASPPAAGAGSRIGTFEDFASASPPCRSPRAAR